MPNMKTKTRSLVLLPMKFVLLACRDFISSSGLTPQPVNSNDSTKPSATLLPTRLPAESLAPTASNTPTALPATLTPAAGIQYTPTPTLIPLNSQLTLNDVNGSSMMPLAVLVGSVTASFGEIFSGVLQDIGRAYLIGTTTDGYVEILWGYDLEDGSQIWLAYETFRPMNHPDEDWEKTGITPDLTVAADFDEYTLQNDPAVLTALGYLAAR